MVVSFPRVIKSIRFRIIPFCIFLKGDGTSIKVYNQKKTSDRVDSTEPLKLARGRYY